jgi:formylglycine-generating enzyme required for sulfatase activity
MKVFISSTCEDLKSFRTAAKDAVLKADLHPILSEHWEGADHPPLDECMQRVDENADVVVVIVARRHGWTPSNQAAGEYKSITRLECERAAARGVKILPFFLADDAEWPLDRREDYRMTEAMKRQERGETVDFNEVAKEIQRNKRALEDFKRWLGGESRQVRWFGNEDQLQTEIVQALARWKRDLSKQPQPTRAPASRAFDRQAYLNWVVDRCEPMDLLGLDARQAQSARLRQVYVPALAGTGAGGPGAHMFKTKIARGKPPDREEEPDPLLLHRLADRSVYVAGAPGAGKSTFCRWLALVTALGHVPQHSVRPPDDFVETLPESLQGRLPVLCALRHFGTLRTSAANSVDRLLCHGDGDWTYDRFVEALAGWLDRDKPGGLDGAAFRQALAKGECLLILDGVDELPTAIQDRDGDHRPRANLLSGLADALRAWSSSGNRVLLTSRPYGLNARERSSLRIEAVDLQPLPEPLQDLFVRRWYGAVDPAEAGALSAALLCHLQERQDEGITEMRQNPMLLTALCVKFHEGRRLPKDVHELYGKVIDQVLYGRYRETIDEQRIRRQLAAIALGMHTGRAVGTSRLTPAASVTRVEVDQILIKQAAHEPRSESAADSATEKREGLLSNSGLLLPRGDNEVEFYHLSFQEFLAAERIQFLCLDGKTRVSDFLAERCGTPEWRRTLGFLFAAEANLRGEGALQSYLDVLRANLDGRAIRSDPNPALLLADCLEIAHAKGWHIADLAGEFRNACEASLDAGTDAKARTRLWEAVGRLGFDDRRGVGVDAEGVPDIAWCDVPEGDVDIEGKAGRFHVAPFRIAKYPVTHAQFQAFIDAADGYRKADWWESGWLEWVDLARPPSARWTAPNGPRETVNWAEAMAFCRWLTARLGASRRLEAGKVVRLLTEWEWQQAATGGDPKWTYPWGKDFSAAYANTREGNLHRTSPVGLYPGGASAFGVLDMAGNVWEWCLNQYEKRRAVAPGGSAPRVVRGGSWLNDLELACAAFRFRDLPVSRNDNLGFRLCLSSHVVLHPDFSRPGRGTAGIARRLRLAGRGRGRSDGAGWSCPHGG